MRAEGDAAATVGRYELGAWDGDGVAILTASGPSVDEALVAGLDGVLGAARGAASTAAVDVPPDGESSVAAPIRGQGADYGALFAELAGDLLNQLDANGTGLDRVRLDGVLETGDGFTAWGYALGERGGGDPPVGINLVDTPTFEQQDATTTLRCRLRRS